MLSRFLLVFEGWMVLFDHAQCPPRSFTSLLALRGIEVSSATIVCDSSHLPPGICSAQILLKPVHSPQTMPSNSFMSWPLFWGQEFVPNWYQRAHEKSL